MSGKRLIDHGDVGEQLGHATSHASLQFLLLLVVAATALVVFRVGFLLLRLLGDRTGVNRVAHAQKVTREQGVVNHHLQNGVHVARLAQVEQATHTAATTGTLGAVGGQIRVVFVVVARRFGELAFLVLFVVAIGSVAAVVVVEQLRIIDQVVAAATVEGLLADSKRMLGVL